MSTKNHPGVYVPPPLIYVAFFFISLLLQKRWPISHHLLDTTSSHVIGWLFIALYMVLFIASLGRFIISKNTLITIKPAKSLQTTGIYARTRNPMYLSLLFLYCGIAVFKGNWWTFLMLPLLILVIQLYVIRKEEAYLQRAFGTVYHSYSQKVRRWI